MERFRVQSVKRIFYRLFAMSLAKNRFFWEDGRNYLWKQAIISAFRIGFRTDPAEGFALDQEANLPSFVNARTGKFSGMGRLRIGKRKSLIQEKWIRDFSIKHLKIDSIVALAKRTVFNSAKKEVEKTLCLRTICKSRLFLRHSAGRDPYQKKVRTHRVRTSSRHHGSFWP